MLLSLDDVGEGDKAKATNVNRAVEGRKARDIVAIQVAVGKRYKFLGPLIERLVLRLRRDGTRNSEGSREVGSMRQNLNAVRIEVPVGDGLGRGVQNRRNMVLGLDVGRYRRGCGHDDAILHITLKDLGASGGREPRGAR